MIDKSKAIKNFEYVYWNAMNGSENEQENVYTALEILCDSFKLDYTTMKDILEQAWEKWADKSQVANGVDCSLWFDIRYKPPLLELYKAILLAELQ